MSSYFYPGDSFAIPFFLIFGVIMIISGYNRLKISNTILMFFAMNCYCFYIFLIIDALCRSLIQKILFWQVALIILRTFLCFLVAIIIYRKPNLPVIYFSKGFLFGYYIYNLTYNLFLYRLSYTNYDLIFVYMNGICGFFFGCLFLFIFQNFDDHEKASKKIAFLNKNFKIILYSFIGSYFFMRGLSMIFGMYLDTTMFVFLFEKKEDYLANEFSKTFMFRYTILWIVLSINGIIYQIKIGIEKDKYKEDKKL